MGGRDPSYPNLPAFQKQPPYFDPQGTGIDIQGRCCKIVKCCVGDYLPVFSLTVVFHCQAILNMSTFFTPAVRPFQPRRIGILTVIRLGMI